MAALESCLERKHSARLPRSGEGSNWGNAAPSPGARAVSLLILCYSIPYVHPLCQRSSFQLGAMGTSKVCDKLSEARSVVSKQEALRSDVDPAVWIGDTMSSRLL